MWDSEFQEIYLFFATNNQFRAGKIQRRKLHEIEPAGWVGWEQKINLESLCRDTEQTKNFLTQLSQLNGCKRDFLKR